MMLKGRKALVCSAIFACVVSAAIALFSNYLLSGIINLVSAGEAPQPGAILSMLAIMLAMGAAGFTKEYLAGLSCESVTHDLRMGFAKYFSSLPYAEIEDLNAGEQISKLQNEIAGVSAYINSNLFQLFDDGVKFIATLFWLMYINPALTVASNLPVVLIMAYVYWSSRIIKTSAEQSLRAKESLNRHSETLLAAFPVVKLYDAARMATDGYVKAVCAWKSQTASMERKKAWLMSLSGVLSCVPLALLFAVGGRMAIDGALAIGALYIFVNLSGNVSGVMMNMPGYVTAFRQFSANIGRLAPYFVNK